MGLRHGILASAALLLALGACTAPVEGTLIPDPYEPVNRRVHAFNKAVDAGLLRPGSQVYVTVAPELLRFLVANGVSNLELPVDAINHLLQGRVETALVTVGRFGVNTVFGAAGLLDPATEVGLPHDPTDFGETLHVWGVPEGAYVELPLFGPGTERDVVGRAVDILLSPTTYLAGTPETEIVLALRIGDVFGQRAAADAEFDAILYRPADSYTELKTTYVQFRRAELGRSTDEDALPDIFPEDDPAAPSSAPVPAISP